MISARTSLLSFGLLALTACAATPESADESTPVPSQAQNPALTSIDDTWNQYINVRIGFSMKIPKQVQVTDTQRIAVDVFEDPASPEEVFIATTHWAPYGNPDALRKTTWSDLKAANIAGTLLSWHIVSQQVRNDAELTAFLKNRYGKDCTIGVKKLMHPGVYDVIIGNGMPPDEGDCFVNYITIIRQSTERQQVVAWNMGQDVTFIGAPRDASPEELQAAIYDQEMAGSFRFLE